MWSVSGLETSLLAALLALALILLVREEQTGRGIASGFALALVALARAEGAVFFVAALTVRLFAHLRRQTTRSAREDVKWALAFARSEEHTSELQSHHDLVCRLLLEK